MRRKNADTQMGGSHHHMVASGSIRPVGENQYSGKSRPTARIPIFNTVTIKSETCRTFRKTEKPPPCPYPVSNRGIAVGMYTHVHPSDFKAGLIILSLLIPPRDRGYVPGRKSAPGKFLVLAWYVTVSCNEYFALLGERIFVAKTDGTISCFPSLSGRIWPKLNLGNLLRYEPVTGISPLPHRMYAAASCDGSVKLPTKPYL